MGQDGPIMSRYVMTGFSDEEIENLRDAYKKCVKFIDIEIQDIDPNEEQKEKLMRKIQMASTEALEQVQVLLERNLRDCKT